MLFVLDFHSKYEYSVLVSLPLSSNLIRVSIWWLNPPDIKSDNSSSPVIFINQGQTTDFSVE